MILPQGFTLRFAQRGDAELVRSVTLACWMGSVALDSTAYREPIEEIAHQIETGAAVILSRGEEHVGSARIYPAPGPPGDERLWVEVKRVGVLKELRKFGLAAPMVAMLEEGRGVVGAQLGVRIDQPRLVLFWESLGYRVADDVQLYTVNPLTPPPVTMRKWF